MNGTRARTNVTPTLTRLLTGMLIVSLGVLLNELLVANAGDPRPDWAWPVSIGLLCVAAVISGSWWALFLDPPAFWAGLVAADVWLSSTGRHAIGWDMFDGDTLRQSLTGRGALVIACGAAMFASVALGKWLHQRRGTAPHS